MKKYIIYGLITVLTLFTGMGCNDFLNQEPINSVTNQNYWKTEKDAQNAVYGLLQNYRTVRGNVIYLYRDRGLNFDVLGTNWEKISNNDMSSYTPVNNRFSWWNEYRVIAFANTIIDNIHRIEDIPQQRVDYYLAQARFVRALTYFDLIRNFGDVPLITKAEDIQPHARKNWLEVNEFIISEAKECARQLPPFSQLLDDQGKPVTSKGNPCKGAALALVAHATAWQAGVGNRSDRWAEVSAACDSIINSGEYTLLGSPQEFNQKGLAGNSSEGIYECDFQYAGEYKSAGSFIAGFCQKWPVQSMTTPATKRTPRMLNHTYNILYPDPNDRRRDANAEDPDYWAQQDIATTQNAVYIKKWGKELVEDWQEGVQQGRIRFYKANDILFRLADIYLLRAEARAHTGDNDGAVKDINIIRDRAGMYKYSLAEAPLLQAVFDERERELFLEGHRFFDIIRFGYYREKLRGKFKTLSDEDVRNGALYLPVSTDMATYNSLATQTPYWKNQFPF